MIKEMIASLLPNTAHVRTFSMDSISCLTVVIRSRRVDASCAITSTLRITLGKLSTTSCVVRSSSLLTSYDAEMTYYVAYTIYEPE